MDIGARLKRIKSILSPSSLEMLIFFVTARCNSDCKTCFYWKNINGLPDLSIVRIKKISSNLGKINNILFSGGEPFLRRDLSEIVRIFVKNNQIKNLTIPTNGLLTKNIIETTAKILKENPDLLVSVSVSIDGLSESHNKIRGVKNNFQTATDTLAKLLKLKESFKNLSVIINTVICSENYKEIEKLAYFVRNRIRPDGHFFEIVRGVPREKGLLDIPPKELAYVYKKIFPLQVLYFKKNLNNQNLGVGLVGFLRRLIREEEFFGSLLYQYKTQFRNYAYKESWTTACLAGKSIRVLESDGIFKDCESKNKKSKDCSCTHVCFINISSLFNWRTYFFEFPCLFLRYKLFRKIT